MIQYISNFLKMEKKKLSAIVHVIHVSAEIKFKPQLETFSVPNINIWGGYQNIQITKDFATDNSQFSIAFLIKLSEK